MVDVPDSLQTPVVNFRDFQKRVSEGIDRLISLQNQKSNEWQIRGSLRSLFEALPSEYEQAPYISNMLNAMLVEKGKVDDVKNILSNSFITEVRDMVRRARVFLNKLLLPIKGAINETRNIVANNLDLQHDTVYTYKRFIDFCSGIDQAVSDRLGEWLDQERGPGFRDPFGPRIVPAEAATEVECGVRI